MNKIISRGLYLFFSFLIISLSAISHASENVLNSIELAQEDGGYVLKLSTNKSVPYKKSIESKDSTYFDLKNITAVQNIETFYNNVDDIDGIVVQQLENEKLRIYVNGENTSNTKIVFDASTETASNEVILNKPISEYSPTAGKQLEESSNWSENDFNLEYLVESVLKNLKKIDPIVVMCAMLFIAIVVGLKSALAKVRMQQEPLIGIAHNNIDLTDEDEIENLQPERTYRSTKVETRDQDIAARMSNIQRFAPPPSAPTQAASRRNACGLNAYKQNASNPYAAQSTNRQAYTNPGNSVNSTRTVQREFTSPVTRARAQAAASNSQGLQRDTQIDSIKFLESVTKIYEQNGRKDLATGLKASLNKTKIAM